MHFFLKRHFLVTLLLIACWNLSAQKADQFPRSTPEAEGISSEGISRFIESFANSPHELHSFMLLRHGKVVAETWRSPYRPDLKHTMYSVSKSFAATAIGLAIHEKLLSVNDPVIKFFPDQLPDSISPFLADLRVKDLLSMSAGQDPEPTGAIIRGDGSWVKSFLATPIVHQPGSQFLYNSACTYMLSAIIQKVTGKQLIEYLRPRLFQPLGITDVDWEVDPQGINTGGWGLRLRTEDMAKFGQLFLQKGVWKGRQILPQIWVDDASTIKVIQHPDLPHAKKDSSDWEQGYCYQMWRCRNNAYRGDGAFGQYIIVMPYLDAVVVITSETPDMQGELDRVWAHLLPAFKDGKLPAAPKATATLKKQLSSTALPLFEKSSIPATANAVSGKKFTVSGTNPWGLQQFTFRFDAGKCALDIKTDTSMHHIVFGNGQWELGETTKPGPSLVFGAKGHFAGLPPSKIATNFRWKDDNTLELVLRYIDSPHTERYICHFEKEALTIDVENSFNKKGNQTLTLKQE